MKEKWERNLAILFIFWIVILHGILWIVLKDDKNLWYNQIFRFAFLPVQLLFTTVLVNSFIKVREKRQKLKLMSLQQNIFFTELGNGILKYLKKVDTNLEKIQKLLTDTKIQDDAFFNYFETHVSSYEGNINANAIYSQELLNYLVSKIELLHSFMRNPLLVENNSFANLLWSIYHFIEEFKFNSESGYEGKQKSTSEILHLFKDIEEKLLREWVKYLINLRSFYPERFSYAILHSPFDFMRKKILNDSEES